MLLLLICRFFPWRGKPRGFMVNQSLLKQYILLSVRFYHYRLIIKGSVNLGINNGANNFLYQAVSKQLLCKTRSIRCAFLDSYIVVLFDLTCKSCLIWLNDNNLFLRFNCLILKYWKKTSKNITWWEISYWNIELI